MPTIPTDPVHSSLAWMKAEGYRLSVFCPNGHGAECDLDPLIERFGRDFIITSDRPRFLAAFRCACGERGHSLIVNAASEPTPRTGNP